MAKLNKRVLFIGPTGGGTTGLTDWTHRNYMVAAEGVEVAAGQKVHDPVRIVAGELGHKPIAEIRGDIDVVNGFQARVFECKRELEAQAGTPCVADQGPENVAYALAFSTIGQEILQSPEFEEYMRGLASDDTVVFYVLPHKALVKADGFRPEGDLDWGEVQFINGIVFAHLEQARAKHGLRYHLVAAEKWPLRKIEIETVLGPAPNPERLPAGWCGRGAPA